MEELPDPPSKFAVEGIFQYCPAGTRVLRIYFREGKHPTSWNAFRHFGPTTSRFDHHTDPRREQARGILYVTTGTHAFSTALAEVYQDTRLIDLKRDEPWVAVFDLQRSVKLLATGGDWPVRAGGNMAINSGSRLKARAWSRAIYEGYLESEGVWYPSSITNRECAAFYERARDALPTSPMFNEALASRKLLSGILKCASDLNYLVS